MEEQLHQQLLRLNEESAGLDARIGVAVGKIEAARAEADKEGIGLYKEIYEIWWLTKRTSAVGVQLWRPSWQVGYPHWIELGSLQNCTPL